MRKKIESVLPMAFRAALQAGAEILKVYESDDFEVERKDDDSPLTRADQRAHEVIEAALAQTGVPLLSEEGADIPAAERQQWDLYWLIDPLDGTKEFIKRNGEFTVNIALMAPRDYVPGEQAGGHAPVAGIVYVPVKDVAYVGVQGRGAWKIEGAADVYPRFAPTMEWDTAAGDAVCRAAGCRVTEKDGTTELRYNKDDLLNPWFLVQGLRVER